jgi:hypothetical protein
MSTHVYTASRDGHRCVSPSVQEAKETCELTCNECVSAHGVTSTICFILLCTWILDDVMCFNQQFHTFDLWCEASEASARGYHEAPESMVRL